MDWVQCQLYKNVISSAHGCRHHCSAPAAALPCGVRVPGTRTAYEVPEAWCRQRRRKLANVECLRSSTPIAASDTYNIDLDLDLDLNHSMRTLASPTSPARMRSSMLRALHALTPAGAASTRLISPQDLRANLGEFQVLDGTWFLTTVHGERDGRTEFLKRRIPAPGSLTWTLFLPRTPTFRTCCRRRSSSRTG